MQAPDYLIDRIYTALGKLIHPELYPGFYKRFFTRRNFYRSGVMYEDLVRWYEMNYARRQMVQGLGSYLAHLGLVLAIVLALVLGVPEWKKANGLTESSKAQIEKLENAAREGL